MPKPLVYLASKEMAEKVRTGSVVKSPAAEFDSPKSLEIISSNGPTPLIGARKVAAISKTPQTKIIHSFLGFLAVCIKVLKKASNYIVARG